MRLYEGWQSGASWRVRWALALKKVSYESVLLDLETGEHQTTLATKNPMRQVPTLELADGLVLAESVAIIEWLEETRPSPPLLPEEPVSRAHVRELVQLVNAGIHPLQNRKVREAVSADPEAKKRWCAHWIERGLTAYETRIQHLAGRFSVGDGLTMADLFLVPQVRTAKRFGADISSCARVLAIYEAAIATPEARVTDPAEVRKRVEAGAIRIKVTC